jgi:DNA-binding MarR family transcriptional regulator
VASSSSFLTQGPLGLLFAHRGRLADTGIRHALGAAGLSLRSAVTLMQLAGGPVNQQALINMLGIDASALVSVLNDLEGLDLIERKRDATDRRRHIVQITDAGVAFLRKAEAVINESDAHLFRGLSEPEQDQFRRLLIKISVPGTPCGES